MEQMQNDENGGAQTLRSPVCSLANSLMNPFLFLQVFIFKIFLIFQF